MMKPIRALARAILTAATLAAAPLAADAAGKAVGACPASNIIGGGMITNVCWSCIFPLRIAGFTLFRSPQPASGISAQGFQLSSRPEVPPGAANKTICTCKKDGQLPTLGIPVGMWLPTSLYETTFTPGCSSVLGGIRLGISDPLYLGTSGNPTSDMAQQSFNHIHTYSFPPVLLMELFTRCNRGYADIDILYMSELDPTWNDPVVAMYGNPVSVFGASLPAIAACSADAISSNMGKPIDRLFWCGGAFTSTVTPYTGYQHGQGPVQFTQATSLRLLAINAVRGLDRRNVGDSALCEAKYDPMLNRSAYRWQVAWPRAEGRRNHASGESPLRWGYSRTLPGVGETPIYLRWDWIDCCTPILGR